MTRIGRHCQSYDSCATLADCSANTAAFTLAALTLFAEVLGAD